ncbi:cardiomyopathy-associated protein 5-like [Narcine bancroftii]|uniref:cardiomyopathy-associated protein 5-like n=1 Tax=Narcine bancroftii TaxID=1343680 RepID=UPI0038320264
MEANVGNLDACISAETDRMEAEICSLEDGVCEGGVLQTDEEEELGESLKDALKDKSVKPKVNYIMSSSSFSMLTVQSEDSGIIWETVSSSRCSTPWASESTASDVYSVESSPLSSPPGKVIFITDELPQSSSGYQHQSNKKGKSEKRHSEETGLRPGDVPKMPRNNSCVLKTQAGKFESSVTLETGTGKMSNPKDFNETEIHSQSLIEHSTTFSKLAGKSYDGNEMFASVEDDVQQHAPVHCQRTLHRNAVEENGKSVILKDGGLNKSFSTIPDEQINVSSAKLRNQGQSETLKHFSDTELCSALPESKTLRLPVEISTKPARASHSKETYKDTEYFSSLKQEGAAHGIIHSDKGDLQKIKVTACNNWSSSSHEISIPDGKCLASDMELTFVTFEVGSFLNGSPAGKTLTKTIPHNFLEGQEVLIKDDQANAMADPEVEYQGSSISISSEATKPVGSEFGVTHQDKDKFVSVMKDEDIEATNVNLNNLSFTQAVGIFSDMEASNFSERQEAKMNDRPFYSRHDPELLEVLDVELNGSFPSMCRTPEDVCHSQLGELKTRADKLHCEENSEIQKAAFNIVAEGSGILNIIAAANVLSVDQEACNEMQDNLIYLQTNPIIKRKDFNGDNEGSNSFDRVKDVEHSRLYVEQRQNPHNSWNSNSFTVGESSVVHTDHFHGTGSTPSNLVGSNPSDAIETNSTHEPETNSSHELGSNPSHATGSNSSHGIESNSPAVETPTPSAVAASNPTSTGQSTTVALSMKKSGTQDDDYFEKYTLVDEQVPTDLVTPEVKLQELPEVPEVENPSMINLEQDLSTKEMELFNFDEFDPRSNDDTTENQRLREFSPRTTMHEPPNKREQGSINSGSAGVFYHKEAGSLLFDSTEGTLSRSHNFPISTNLVDLTLLEEPPALAFYYKDLYEEAKGRREQNNEQSDEDSSNPEISFPCQSSDTDEGSGLYFEKYVLKDDILDSSRGIVPEQPPFGRKASSQNVSVGTERITLFSENEHQFPAMSSDETEVPIQERDSEKIMEVQKDHEEESKEGPEEQKPESIRCEKESEPDIGTELKEDDFIEMACKQIQGSEMLPVRETFYGEDMLTLTSNADDHLDVGRLTNIEHSFEEDENFFSETELENVNVMTMQEIKGTHECISNMKMPIYPIQLDALDKEQPAEEERTECRPEEEYAVNELGQRTEQEGSGMTENTEYDQINDDRPFLEFEEIASQTVREEYGNADYRAGTDEGACEGILNAVIGPDEKQLHLESTEIPGASDEMDMLDIEIIDLKGTESRSVEKFNLESESQGSQIKNDATVSETNNYERISGLAEESQKEKYLAADIVQSLRSKCELPDITTQEILTDTITDEQDARHTFDGIQTEQDSWKNYEMEALQDHYNQDFIHDQADGNIESFLHENQEHLFIKDTEEEPKDLPLLKDVKVIEDENNLDGAKIVDKESGEIHQEKTQESSLQTTKGEDIDRAISQKPPKPNDTYCITCGLPIYAIDKLFGEHKDHDVIAIDTAVVRVKEKLDEFVQAAEEKASRTEEFVLELEDAFNAVEVNFAKEKKYLEEQHEEIMKLLLSQYTEMSQVLEEEKKMKLEHLCDQMVHYRCNIDSTKEDVEKTKKSFVFDDMAFLKSYRMINNSVVSALETAISLDLKPRWCSSFEDLAIKSSRSGFESLKNLPVPHSPTVLSQEPNTATSTTITVYWTVEEEDIIDYFQVYCMDQSEGNREQTGSSTEEYKMAVKESYCTLDNLEPSKCYLVWVMAVNFAGCSLPSEKMMIQTVPSAPMINAEESTVCWDSATIRWTSTDLSAVDFFILEYHRQNDLQKSKFRSVSGIRGCEQTVSLPPLENFLFFVKAVNNLGSSDTSKPALISTKSTRFHLNKVNIPPNVQLSEDGTVIHFDDLAVENESSQTECPFVLGETLPARGCHYWEVTVDRCEAYRIGIAYPISRNSSLGRSNKSWCMQYYASPAGHRYEFLHNRTSHEVLLSDSPASVGVFVDCDSGQLSFFNAQSGQLLHTFKHRFTDFICPAFVVEKPGFLSVCTGVELPKFAKQS